MSVMPDARHGAVATALADLSLNPRMFGKINGLYVPTTSVDITQTSYGIADTATVETFLAGQKIDYGALSQSMKGVPFQINGGFIGAGKGGNYTPVFYGLLEEIENDYDNNIIAFHNRGLLANLVDDRITINPNMNDTAQHVIQKLIDQYGLKSRVASDPHNTSVGAILKKDDYVTGLRNMRALDFIHMLCRWVGWTTRTVGDTIVVGPPPDPHSGLVLEKRWGSHAGMNLKVTHNALHNRNIKVRVVSYIQSRKTRARAKLVQQGPAAAQVFPGQLPAGGAVKGSQGPVGHQSGHTIVGERADIEEYVVPVANTTSEECNRLAQVIADEINRHEFVADLTFTPTPEEFIQLCKVSPDFNVHLTGCSQASNNGLYYPKQVTWTWKIGDHDTPEGLEINLKMVNHPLPMPTGAGTNTSLSDVS